MKTKCPPHNYSIRGVGECRPHLRRCMFQPEAATPRSPPNHFPRAFSPYCRNSDPGEKINHRKRTLRITNHTQSRRSHIKSVCIQPRLTHCSIQSSHRPRHSFRLHQQVLILELSNHVWWKAPWPERGPQAAQQPSRPALVRLALQEEGSRHCLQVQVRIEWEPESVGEMVELMD